MSAPLVWQRFPIEDIKCEPWSGVAWYPRTVSYTRLSSASSKASPASGESICRRPAVSTTIPIFGSTTNPKVGLVWTPVSGLDIRAAYSTSFRAPSVAEEAQVARGTTIFTDSFGNGTPAFSLQGQRAAGGREVEKRRARITLKPAPLPGAELSLKLL